MDKTQGQSTAFKIEQQYTEVNVNDRFQEELLGIFENSRLKNQQWLTAITSAVISALAVLAVIQIFSHTIGQQFSGNTYSVNNIGLATLTGLTVGLVNVVLGKTTTNQIKSSLNNLSSQIQILQSRIREAEQRVEFAEDEKQELQDKLNQVIQNVELNYSNDLIEETDLISLEEEVIEPPGNLLDFLDNLHNWFKVTTTPEQLLGSSTLEEVQQRKDELQYRQVWLQALEEETNRELQLLAMICQSSEQAEYRETNEG